MWILIFLAVEFLGTAQGLSLWWAHAIASALALWGLTSTSKFYLFWFLLILALLTATEPRFSLEFLILKTGFIGLALKQFWTQKTSQEKFIGLSVIFLLMSVLEFFGICYAERGSNLIWMPVFLALARENILDKKPRLIYGISFLILLSQKKITSILGFLVLILERFKNKIFTLTILVSFLILNFCFKESFWHFLKKSILARLYIWGSCLKGFMADPIWGHGFGTFALDIPAYRILKNIWGARGNQQLSHAHNLFLNSAFEMGLVGCILITIFFIFIYKQYRPAFFPLLTISVLDCPLTNPHQYLLLALILTMAYDFNKNNLSKKIFIFKQVSTKYSLLASVTGLAIGFYIFTFSVIGHYYYDLGDYERAIKWDKHHSLYYLMRGANSLNTNTLQSEADFTEACRISPNIGYFYGYLGASQLANNKFLQAEQSIKKAIKFTGDNAYWQVILAFSNLGQQKKDLYQKHMSRATALNPYIPILLKNPQLSSKDIIGGGDLDPRIVSFYRKGPPLNLPVPYVEER